MESQGTGVEGIGRNRSDLREAKLQPFARVVGVSFRLANDWSAPTSPARRQGHTNKRHRIIDRVGYVGISRKSQPLKETAIA